MAFYDFVCKQEHVTERFFRWQDLQGWIKCPSCSKRATRVVFGVGHTAGKPLSDKFKRDMRYAFGKRAKDFNTAADVDKALGEFRAKYPWLVGDSKQSSNREAIERTKGNR